MSRRFLNLVYRDYTAADDLLYSISRLDASQLFYKSAAAAAARKKNGSKQAPAVSRIDDVPEIRRLPAPSFSFQPFMSKMYHVIKGVDVFAPFGAGDGRILCADGAGYAAAFDMASRSMLGMPAMSAPKGPKHVAISSIPRTDKHAFAADPCDDCDSDDFILKHVIEGDHAESLYVMDMSPGNPVPFEVLSFSSKGWLWRPLPRPPFFADRRYKPTYDPCVAVDGTTVFVSPDAAAAAGEEEESADIVGTYRFDTVTQEWDKAGDWTLPFLGKTEHVPEPGVWLGLSARFPHHLCAISSLDPPTVRHVWADIDPPESWWLMDQALLNLGSGRFCTAKFFDVSQDDKGADDDDAFDIVVVFTGVEVLRCDGESGGLKMIKHKSKCVIDLDITCVL